MDDKKCDKARVWTRCPDGTEGEFPRNPAARLSDLLAEWQKLAPTWPEPAGAAGPVSPLDGSVSLNFRLPGVAPFGPHPLLTYW